MNNDLITLFSNAKSVLIVVAKMAKLDGLAAALSLQLALIQQGKSAKVCTEADVNDADKLTGANNISKTLDLGGNVLKVSFPYSDGAIDKVTYNITDDRFNLLIEPRVGNPPLKNQDVQFAYTGGEVDLIVTIDAPNLEAVGDLYLDNPDLFQKDKLVNLDRRFDNQQYGAFNLVEKQFSSTCEIVAKLLESLHWDLNPDVATNLYTGLVASTNNFTSFSTNAQSFETASYLLKNGARKIPLASLRQPTTRTGLDAKPFQSLQNQPAVMPDSSNQSIFQSTQEKPQPKKKQPPQDWLKPKIFKSSDLV